MRFARAPRRFAVVLAAWAMVLASFVPLLAHGLARKAQEPWAALCSAAGSPDAPDPRPVEPSCGPCAAHTSATVPFDALPAALALLAFSDEVPGAPRAVPHRPAARATAQPRGPPAAS